MKNNELAKHHHAIFKILKFLRKLRSLYVHPAIGIPHRPNDAGQGVKKTEARD